MVQIVAEDAFDETIASWVTFVDFYADWCGPCQALLPRIEELAETLGDTAQVIKVNVDDAQGLAGKFGIMSIPTLLVFKDGEMVEKMVGSQDTKDMKAAVEKHI